MLGVFAPYFRILCMKRYALPLGLLAATSIAMPGREVHGAGLDDIETVVVLYAENRSFDNLYGRFPGANGLSGLAPPTICSGIATVPC